MRIWRILAALPTAAIGMLHLRWTVEAAAADVSGPSVGDLCVACFYGAIAAVFVLASLGFVTGKPPIVIEKRRGKPRPLHPSEDTSTLFY